MTEAHIWAIIIFFAWVLIIGAISYWAENEEPGICPEHKVPRHFGGQYDQYKVCPIHQKIASAIIFGPREDTAQRMAAYFYEAKGITPANWYRSDHCDRHGQEVSECGCSVETLTVITPKGDVVFLVNTTAQGIPKMLGFHVDFGDTRFGDHCSVYGHQHFEKLARRFLKEAEELIDKYGATPRIDK